MEDSGGVAEIMEPISQDQFKSLQDQILQLQKTVDRMYEATNEFLSDQNEKVNDTRERVGKLESVFSEIVETFRDVGSMFSRQTKSLESVVKDSVTEQIKPIADDMERMTKAKPKIIHYRVDKKKQSLLGKILRRKKGGE